MDTLMILGYCSVALIIIAGFLHARRVYQGSIVIHPMSWFIWFFVAIALFASYATMGTTFELYAAAGNILFPGVNAILSLGKQQTIARKREGVKVTNWDYGALVLGCIAIIVWYVVKSDIYLSQFANYIAIVADMCALLPTVLLVRKKPMIEKPLPWLLFSLGFVISMETIQDGSSANYILPLYMLFASGYVFLIQVIYRWKHNIHEKWY